MPPKRVRGVMSKSVNRGSVVSPGVKTPYQCSWIVSHQTSSFNFLENVHSQINPFPSRQYECSFIRDENGGRRGGGREYTKQGGNDSHFQRDFGICIVQMITAEYLRGRLNTRVDWPSRNFQDSLLSPRVFQNICVKRGFPELDLFASRACHQIQSYLL